MLDEHVFVNADQPVGTSKYVNAIRFNLASWLKCYPDSDIEEFAAEQLPLSYLGFLGRTAQGLVSAGIKDPDFLIRVVAGDGALQEYIGEKEFIPAMLQDYAREQSVDEEKMVNRLAADLLNVTYNCYILSFPVITAEGKLNTALSDETAEAVKEYCDGLIDDENFDVCVIPYLVNCLAYEKNEQKFFAAAQIWFNEGEKTPCEELGTLEFTEASAALLGIPVIVRERHHRSFFFLGEIQDWMDGTYIDAEKAAYPDNLKNGRNLELFELDQESVEDECPELGAFEESEACVMICGILEESESVQDYFFLPRFILPQEIGRAYSQVLIDLGVEDDDPDDE